MTLLINPKYRGRFDAKARELIKAGTRVGMVWITDSKKFQCHVCQTWTVVPPIDPVHKDAFAECSACKMPFVIAQV